MMEHYDVVGDTWHDPICLYSEDGERKNLPNWYRKDKYGYNETECFTWGYSGEGPSELAYSILREIFGKTVAEREYDNLFCIFTSRLDKKKSFQINSSQIAQILGLNGKGRPSRKRQERSFQDPGMVARGALAAIAAGSGPGGDLDMDVVAEQGILDSIKDKVAEWMRNAKGG